MPRLFLGVFPPDSVRDQLLGVCHGISGAAWVKPHQLHLTLRFFGSVTEDEANTLSQALATLRHPRFDISVLGAGVFPGLRRAHVVWAGLQPRAPLVALKQDVDAVVGPDPEARRYRPHLTLARFRSPPPQRELQKFLQVQADLQSPPFTVQKVLLIESHLRPQGSLYSVRQEVALE